MNKYRPFLVRATKEHDAIRGVYKPGQIYKAARDKTHWKIYFGPSEADFWLFAGSDRSGYFKRKP